MTAQPDEFYYCKDCGKWSATAYWRVNGVWQIRCNCCGRYVDVIADEDRVIDGGRAPVAVPR